MERHGKYAAGIRKMQFTISEADREQLREAAAREGVTMSDIIRDGIAWRIAASPGAVNRLHRDMQK